MRLVEDLERDLLGVLGRLVELGRGGLRHLLEDFRARIVGPVDAVAEPGEAGVLGVGLAQPAVRVGSRADLVQHRACGKRRPAVRRALQRSDGPDHARRQVAAGGCDDPGGEGGGVQAVIGEQHEVGVEPVDAVGGRLLAFHHPEQVGRVAEVVAWLDQLEALGSPVADGHDGRDDGDQSDRLLERGLGDGSGRALRRDGRAQGVHRIGGGIQRCQRAASAVLQPAVSRHLPAQGRELFLVGKLSVPEQVGRLLEGPDRREVFDEVAAAIDEPAVGPVHLADGGLGRDDPLQPRAELRHEA